ncbi:hypothetical protein WJX73_008361 [Symbiochloris irregularis]|uniref:GCVT N-terminal domain-containing protein n=1 Tax=Symbiochloris irregularis TaxID=706552 RepID=A0AAW1PQY8_9CHLO
MLRHTPDRSVYRPRKRQRQHQHDCSAAADLDIPLPDIGEDLVALQESSGATFSEAGVALSFESDEEAHSAVRSDAVLADRSHHARFRVSGRDALKFLQAQSTNDFLPLRPGQGCNTVFVTAQARTIELATCYVLQPNSVLITIPADVKQALLDRLNKYIFFGDEVEITDVSSQCSQLVMAGPGSKGLLRELGAPSELLDGAQGAHGLLNVGGRPVLLAVGSGLHHPGYTLLPDEGVAGELWSTLTEKGAVPMGELTWERERILGGRPRAGRELTEAHTPLEAGLWGCISLDKGCYIGQETLAKVSKLGALNRELWGLRLSAPAEAGAPVFEDGKKIDEQNSVQEPTASHQVPASESASRGLPDGPAAAPPSIKNAQSEEQQEKLRAMQERLQAWQQQQQQQQSQQAS